MKLTKKLLKPTVAMLSLITLTGATTPIVAKPTIIQAKKAKKKQKIQKATSNYDVPKIKKFTHNIFNKYNLEGHRWAKTTITYNDDNLTPEQQDLVEQAIDQINQLNIVTINKTTKAKANITFKLSNKEKKHNIVGETLTNDKGRKYKGLIIANKTTITLYSKELNKFTNDDYKLEVNDVALHELGHALGLDHNDQNKYEIMQPTAYIHEIAKIDSTHIALDQDYINGLAVIYQN